MARTHPDDIAAANNLVTAADPPVIDYEGSRYRTDFWEGRGREYEDATERLALARLLPARGGRLLEIGAGFGRLADLYRGYSQVVLFDYSRSLLHEAMRQLGHDPRFIFAAGNIYQLPLATASVDSLVMVRVMHHLADVPQALAQIQRVLHRQSVGVIEYANKRNLKAVLRWISGRQSWSPFAPEPVEFVALNFDFHPGWMAQRVRKAGLTREAQLAVSHLRVAQLKAHVAAATLARIDARLFSFGGRYPLAPSVFLQVGAPSAPAAQDTDPADLSALFQCPHCPGGTLERRAADLLLCRHCARRIARVDGIWDFKQPA